MGIIKKRFGGYINVLYICNMSENTSKLIKATVRNNHCDLKKGK